MDAKEKAIELVKMYKGFEMPNESIASKQCALICVKEIIKALNDDIYIQGETDIYSHIDYWEEVRCYLENY